MSTTPSSALPPVPSVDATGRIPAGERALVLGGGGSTGNAWLIGVVAGLAEAGLDVTTADLTVGTSAGSTAAAQLAGASPAELLDGALTAPPPRTAPASTGRTAPAAHGRTDPAAPVTDHLARMRAIIDAATDPADLRRRVGAAALDLAGTQDEHRQERWRAIVAARLPVQTWPRRTVLLTAVDARTGAPVVFDRSSGVDLADAVAASCSSGAAYAIGDGRYIDGGYRTNAENADLAAGYARVLVLSPLGGRTLTPAAWGLDLATQVEALRAGGSRVETVAPGPDAEHLFGVNAMDGTLRPLAARAGRDQGKALAERLGELWG
ncbi:patatin-like phospholipase family protein [Promicromonospora sp. NPDC052451]|uniref:patatin-like phospholipase family protein n=1 Tax=unclassified Promicromonospora TaxID=2647929 RepID=UPI0037CB1342